MPRISQELSDLSNKLCDKINQFPFEFTINDYLTLSACEYGNMSHVNDIKSDLDEVVQLLPDKYESIILFFESEVMYSLDKLNLINNLDIKVISKKPNVYTLSDCTFNGVHCHILNYCGEGSFIFSKSEIKEFKSKLDNSLIK